MTPPCPKCLQTERVETADRSWLCTRSSCWLADECSGPRPPLLGSMRVVKPIGSNKETRDE